MSPTPTLTRRTFAKSACAGVVAAAATRLWTPTAAFAAGGQAERTLVVAFLRGGMDGLSALIPYGDPRYREVRPTIGIPQEQILPLDATFGLHPAMAPLHDLYRDGHLAMVHSSGSTAGSRSHFEQQALIESGGDGAFESTGWLARHLAATGAAAVPLHAMSWGNATPASLQGDLAALSMPRLGNFNLSTFGGLRDRTRAAMHQLYDGTDEVLSGPGLEALDAIDRVRVVREGLGEPLVEYPEGPLGNSLREIAGTIRADVGLAAATVDVGGWDIHAHAGDAAAGPQAKRLAELAGGLRAFADDLGPLLGRTTVLVMSEFGRRVRENASGGTDHGRGNLMFVLGDGVRGGIHGDWRGLEDDGLDDGDVPVTTDYRNVVGEVVAARHGASAFLSDVFPRHQFAFQQLV